MLHRMLMEKHLGRTLRTDEVVHHIDCNPTNNDVDNLQVMPRVTHTKLHNVLASLLSIDSHGLHHLNGHLRKHGLRIHLERLPRSVNHS
jgi:HNH endonuclease